MDESTQTEAAPVADAVTPVESAPAVADALATDTAAAAPAQDPVAEPTDDAPTQEEDVEHPVLTSMREELGKIANMPAHIWQAIEGAFDRVAQKL